MCDQSVNISVTPWMTLAPNCGSDRAWVWSSKADYADETPTPELLAIRFANAESEFFIVCVTPSEPNSILNSLTNAFYLPLQLPRGGRINLMKQEN